MKLRTVFLDILCFCFWNTWTTCVMIASKMVESNVSNGSPNLLTDSCFLPAIWSVFNPYMSSIKRLV
uniref:Putative secreted protein n=1 Tax=Anopheles triannulatus TaxID=58253 RepID=A0A2M4B7P3_9DIPT